MRAIVVDEFGPPEGLLVREAPTPVPGPGEVLVEIHAAPVNYVDTLVVGGAYQFLLGTWETYGGAASEFGVAGPAYQDQIFDNAIAAGGASNWTAYDGC